MTCQVGTINKTTMSNTNALLTIFDRLSIQDQRFYVSVLDAPQYILISEQLEQVKGDSLLAVSVRANCRTNIKGLVRELKEQIRDGHRDMIARAIGEELTSKIEEI